MNKRAGTFITLVVSFQFLSAQSPVKVISGGYSDPASLSLAPGQVTTLFLDNVRRPISTYTAAPGFPLPTSLAGLSVSMREFVNQDPIPIPILAVRQSESGCVGVVFGSPPTMNPCRTIAVTIQVPTGLSRPRLPLAPPDPTRRQELLVSEDGVASPIPAPYSLFPDNIHVVTPCDPIQNNRASPDCNASARHADGKPVQGSNPAPPGEIVTVYALGLGETTPVVPAGVPSPLPPAILPFPFRVRFNFAANAEPVWQAPESATVKLDLAVFAGLSPGSVGLYQVNFRVPQPPPGTPACFTDGVQSNLTATLVGGTSFDGVKLCVGVEDGSVIARE